MAATASIARIAMRNGLYHRVWSIGAEVEQTIRAAGSHVGASGVDSRVGDAVLGAAKAGAVCQRGSGRGVDGPLRRGSLPPEALSPGDPDLRNIAPHPSDLVAQPDGSRPVSFQRNARKGVRKRVETSRCCGKLWAPGRKGQGERSASSPTERGPFKRNCLPGSLGSDLGENSAPRAVRTAPTPGSALREHRTAPERMRSRGLFRRRFLFQHPGPRPPGFQAGPEAKRILSKNQGRPRRAANRHPQFPQYNYQTLVPENEAAGTAVLRVVAQDPDPGEAGRLVYSLAALMNSRSLELFSIDPQSGLIRTAAALDRESMERHYLRVTAQDHGSPRLSATTMVAVTVADRNDHAPVFEQAHYRETLRENVEEGYPILQLRATDGDAPPNANLRYRFVGSPAARSEAAAAFEIDPRSGLISTSGRVDREHMESYELVVEASDQGQEPGPRSATVRVHITVLDENDNTPQFSEKRYVAQVREDVRPHTVVLRVTATDRDKDANGLVHYNIISGNSRGHFAIDSLTGEIQVVAPLDFEAEREYVLRIRAQDAGRPPLSNNTGLASIQVVDINDHAPIFVSTPFQVSVLENAPLGHSVIHIQAVDADHGENSRLEYSLTGVAPDTPFVINSATGWVSVSGPLDRESVEHYFFGVEARDHGSPPLSASASVTVTVLDVNDNRPEFTMKEYHLRLNEDAAVGTSVVSVTAVDRDANSAISYQITGGNSRNRFAISTQGGVGLVTLALPLDYKQERYFKLVLTASDRALHDHCYVHINITDANTHRPVFQSAHYSVSMNEDRPVGSTVVVISASDDDVGENARITYLLEDNLPQFRIDANSGAITLQAPLDYEDQVTYTLAITARDNGIPQKADTTYVEVMVNDVNDNAPQFVASHYTGLVSEDAPPFTSVLQISATDRDAHANGRVQYTFQNGEDGDGDFTIEPTSGIVRTVRRLDREAVPVYELTAYAVDRGVPPLRTPVSIQVTVQDVNDNAPVFPAEEFEVRVKENSIVGSVVAQITAVDPDEGPNAHIMYQIVEGNIPELFQMDIFSGELTALIDLDYEARQEYVIVVQATSAPLVSRATVHVRLVDQNDNSPVLNNFQILFNNYVSNRSDTFPSGIIGRIPAYDPDVSDHLFYSFERGNELQLLVVNQTSGELRLSRKLDNNRPLVASMLVTVTDGLHSVTAQCVLRVVIITEELLANSLTVRLENMWQERFLSPLLGHFLEGVAAVLATPTEDVFIFNIQNDTDVGGTVLNVSFSALAPRGAGAGAAGPWFSSEELQEQLYVRRAALAARSLLDVLPFDDNVCLREPCENYMKCVSVLRFDSSAPFLASASPPYFCETELDLCYSNPCRNGGACARREGGYTCVCRPRFTGEDCELDTEAGRCVPGVCRNGGTCTNAPNGGFRCQCPAGGAFEGPRCEVAARSFPPSSFVMFRGLRQRFHLTLSLSFATVQPSGLLFYNGRLNEKHDFLALELVAGQVRLTYSTGESNTVVSPTVPGGLSDGRWHTVHLRYYNKPRTDALGGAQGPSKDKVAVLSVDDCNVAVALRFGAEIGNYSCAAAGVQTSSKKSLDLTGPLLLGGVPNLPENFPVSHKDFIGCMRDLHIDGRRMDMAAFVANNGTMAGCQAKLHFCASGPCKNSGFCSERWGGFSCDCPVGFGGKDCRLTMAHPYHFHGNGTLTWDFGNDMTVSVPWYLGLAFRTRATKGVLMQVQLGPHSVLLLQMTVSDGRWHDLRLELQEEPGGRRGHHIFMVSLDFNLFQDTVAVGGELQGLKVKQLHVGGLPPTSKEEGPQGLVGCIQGVWIGYTPFGSSALPPPSHRVNVEPGCVVTNACASGPCPPHAHCKDLWQTFSCTCWPGYYGPGCVDACLLNPCQNQGSCRHLQGSPHGYTCDCTNGYFGQHCEHRMDQQCPRGWWGSPSCGPCNCDVHKGFDPNCNKTNGQCHCKEFHYRPRGSDSCLPCDCYPVGSTSRSCAPHSGQCPCRPGALGRQCNSCDSPFAEVTASGCRVLYDACPKSLRAGVWWPQTKFGVLATVPCPRGALGAAVRLCDEDQGWLEPDLFNCTSPAFRELSLLLDGLELNKTTLDTVEAKKLAQRLREVTGQTDHYFSQDVRVTARLLAYLLAFESHQQGFGLTATQDAHFNENLLWAGSALLAPETGDLWAALGQRAPGGSPGSAGLVQHLEEYAATLARNMELTYLNPVGLVTPNIMLSIDRMEHPSSSQGARRYPRYHSNLFRGQDAWDPHTHVLLPSQSPQPSPSEVLPTSTNTENATASSVVSSPAPLEPEPEPGMSIVILLVYRTLGGLLPAQFQAERRGARSLSLPPHHKSLPEMGHILDGKRLEGDLELLAVFTHVAVAVSVTALVLTAAVLLSLRSLKSNVRGIHANVAAALGVAELVFLLGIHRTHNQLLCTAVAILLHYFFLSTFAWLLVQGLHLYRMQVEPRNVDRGAMRFYHALGWGVPAVLLGLAVGLDPDGYGNPDFCWISIHEPLIWSFAGPIILVIVMNGTMFLLAARTSCSTGQREAKKTSVLRTLRSSFLLLLLVSASWLFGLLAVNHSVLAFHYLHAGLCGLQGLAVLLLFCVLNTDARAAWTPACLSKKAAPEETRPAPGTGSGAYNNTALFEESGLIRITLGASTVSSVSSARSGRAQDQDSQRGRSYLRDNVLVRHGSTADHTEHSLQAHAGPTDLDVAMFHRDAGADSDSDSDLSLEEERSLSIPSSESEDNGRTRGRFHRPLRRAAQSERLLAHPKDMDGNDLLSYWPALGECEAAPCALQAWGSERRLGLDANKDAANNNQPDLALTSGDETSLGRAQRQRKGILKNRLQYPLVPQTRGTPELSWCRAATLGHRAVPAASYGRIYAGGGTGSLSQPASRYSSREQLDLLLRRQLSRERLVEVPVPASVLHPLSRPGSQEHLDAAPARLEPRDRGSTLPRRQPPRDYPGTMAGRFGSRDALDLGAPREWLSTLPPPRRNRDLDPQHPPLPMSPQRQLSRDPLLPSRPLDSLSRISNSRERLDQVPSRHPSREALGPAPQLLRAREDPASGPTHGPSTEQLDILSSILASFNSSALSSVQSSSTPSGPHTTATPSATASALGPSTPRSATSHSISELSPDSE
ncbi:Cadherin EGF LAG seven-pass G-type receptor 3 [Cricetulus griseus]|uniref:Cadherin EGF LAG seven-pass G-type receptor 3 n=1 Tax=Cricetulus griseus TaxID=10029 RepID=G3HKN9_CRIGR|nr:Cadherin EGF LAG seven-pass G-type receptor 3 [Cricetulus griseus]